MSKSLTPVRSVVLGHQPARDPLGLAPQIQDEMFAAKRNARDAVAHARRAGELLLEAKSKLQHGEWLPWLNQHVDIEESVAQKYMRLARHAAFVDSLIITDQDLSIRHVDRLLSAARAKRPKGNTRAAAPPALIAAIAGVVRPSGTPIESCPSGHILRALRDLKKAKNIVLLAAINHFWTIHVLRDIRSAGFAYRSLWLVDEYPEGFVRTGSPLGAMHLQKGWKGPLAIRPLRKK